jgi:hypothetical protein
MATRLSPKKINLYPAASLPKVCRLNGCRTDNARHERATPAAFLESALFRAETEHQWRGVSVRLKDIR